jgi:hypothetical protein
MRAKEFMNKSRRANELSEPKLVESPESKRELLKLIAGQGEGKPKLTLKMLHRLKLEMNELKKAENSKSDLLKTMYSQLGTDVDEAKVSAKPDRAKQHIQDMALDAIEHDQK